MGRFERFIYKNHLGETLDFGVNGLYVDLNDLRDYAWEVIDNGSRITNFRKGITAKTLPVTVAFKNRNYVRDLKNKLFEFCEKDVLAQKYGRVIIGDYYYSCYVTASAKNGYAHDPCSTQFSLTLTTDKPYWIAERTHSFRKIDNGEDDNLDYPYDYPYDYYSGSANQRIVNTFFAPVDFRMVIFGAVVNPSINIGGHVYKVNVTLSSGEYLTIDSVEKTIVLTQNNGTKVNKFDYRDRASYIFEPISSGSSPVTWVGNFSFDITLLEKRSEPKWT